MVQTGDELTADERANQLQYHDRLVMDEPPAAASTSISWAAPSSPPPSPKYNRGLVPPS